MARDTRRGISWNILGAVVTNTVRLLSVVVLGRLLAPHDFGVVAAALTVMLVLYQVRDLGIGAALIQRAELEIAHVSTAFAFSLYVGVVLGALLVVAAPWIGALYGIPEAVDLVRALGAMFVLRGISTVPLMMCRRAMHFRAIAIVDASAYAAGVATMMILALVGAGPWSLVIGYLVEEALAAVAYVSLHRPPFTLRVDRQRLRELLGFGVGHTIIQIANILAIHGDNFVVGRAVGAVALGFYTRAYELIKLPAVVYMNIAGNVLFPAFSRVQADPERLAVGFRRATLVNGLVLFPASAVLVVFAPEVIRVVIGGQWDAAVLPFQILALVMMLRTSYKVGATVGSAAGRVYAVAVANIIYMVCVIGGAIISIRWGIAGVATSTAIAIGVIYLLCCRIAMDVTKLSARTIALAHVPGVAIALVLGAACWAIAEVARELAIAPGVIFVIAAVVGPLLAVGGILLWMRGGSVDAIWLRDEIRRLLRRRKLGSARR